MSLLDHVHVSRRFQRSIRIDTDLRDPKALEGFVCPKSSADVLLTVARHVADTGHAAFTWTGPYGSGKSSLVIALSAVLSGNPKVRAKAAATVGAGVAKALWAALPPRTKGWRMLPVVGRRAHPADAIGEALVRQRYVDGRTVRRLTEARVIDVLSTLAAESPNTRGGLVVILDEMGKFLEGAASQGTDIHLFQELAEAACRSRGRLLVIGILHQSFDEYAQRLARETRDEWAKVQGRFVDLVVNVAGDEQLELLARAIENDRAAETRSSLSTAVADVVRAGRPGAAPDLARTLDKCWPLHPVVACLLGPISRRRFGQNQRSLFGFLSSAEPFGFQDFLRNAKEDDLFRPDRLWDYLRTNLEPAILASADGHRWATSVEVVERCDAISGSAPHVGLLKTIALLDLFRERSGLMATPALLSTCVASGVTSAQVHDALEQLAAWSFVILRRHTGSYAIYAGSDFDVEQAVTQALSAIRGIRVRDLRILAGLHPVLAKRHYHETGALRWFDVDLVPVSELARAVATESSTGGATGRFLLAIPIEDETSVRARELCEAAAEGASGDVVIGLSPHAWQVIQLAHEFLAITVVYDERPELAGDPVARREVLARLTDTRARLEAELARMLDTAEWFRAGKRPARASAPELNILASVLANERYPLSPKLPNELLNRLKPSSNAVAAQKALLKHMVKGEGEPRLGINGFPAEGGLCDAILLKARLYRPTQQGRWTFTAPSKGEDPCRISPMWQAASDLLQGNHSRTVSIPEIYDLWRRPPFGVKDGLLPVFAVAFVLAHRDRLALYREGIFQARFAELEVDYLTMDPGMIQVRWMDLSDVSRQILSGLGQAVRALDATNRLVHLEPIDVARGLVAIHEKLSPWTKRTSRLSANAQRVRALFKQASDPNKFLFDDIPALFGDALSAPLESSDPSKAALDNILQHVRQGLEELTGAYGDMLRRLQETMLTELQVPNDSPQALADLRARAENILQLTGDFRLNAFIGRLSQFTGTEADMEGIASLVTNKPAREWVDADIDHAGVEVAALAQQFIRSEAFARVKGRPDKRHSIAVIVGIHGRPTPVVGDFDVRDSDRDAIEELITRVEAALQAADTGRRNVILAALAELSARFLAEVSTTKGSKASCKAVRP